MENNKIDTYIKNQENAIITNNPEIESQKKNKEDSMNETPKEPEKKNINNDSRENVILSQNHRELNKNKESINEEFQKKPNQNEKVGDTSSTKNYKCLYIIGFIILIIACGIPLIYILFKPKKKDIKILDDEENDFY